MMATASVQVPGYNDCSLAAISSLGNATRKPFQPLPQSMHPPPPPQPSSPLSVASDSDKSEDSRSDEEVVVTLDSTTELVSRALATPTRLSAQELAHYKSRLESNLPKLGDVHLVLISETLDAVLTHQNKATQHAARNLVVEHMMKHSGTSAWALPLRKVVESIDL